MITLLPDCVAVDIIKFLALPDLLRFLQTCRWALYIGTSDSVQHYIDFGHLNACPDNAHIFERAARALNIQACAKLAIMYMYRSGDAVKAAHVLRMAEISADAPFSYVLLRPPWTDSLCLKARTARLLADDANNVANLNAQQSTQIINSNPFTPAHSRLYRLRNIPDRITGSLCMYRLVAVVWIFEVFIELEDGKSIGIETACLATALMDRYTASIGNCWREVCATNSCRHKVFTSKCVQAIASACILIASRMTARSPLTARNMVYYTDFSYSYDDIIAMVGEVMGRIGSNLHMALDFPTDPMIQLAYMRIVLVVSFQEASIERINLLAGWICAYSNRKMHKALLLSDATVPATTLVSDMTCVYDRWHRGATQFEEQLEILATLPIPYKIDMLAHMTGPST